MQYHVMAMGVDLVEWNNERGERTTTFLCLISVGYHSELRIAITFLQKAPVFIPNDVSTLNMRFNVTNFNCLVQC